MLRCTIPPQSDSVIEPVSQPSREGGFDRKQGSAPAPAYDEVARGERLTAKRVRQIASEVLQRREVDDGSAHALMQLARLQPLLKIAAEAAASGDVKASETLEKPRFGKAKERKSPIAGPFPKSWRPSFAHRGRRRRRPGAPHPIRRSTIIALMWAIALAGLRCLGQVWAQFKMVWQR